MEIAGKSIGVPLPAATPEERPLTEAGLAVPLLVLLAAGACFWTGVILAVAALV